MTLDFETNKLIEELKVMKPKRVLVQLPEGIKQNAFDILREVEALGIEVIFSGETCWGGCAISVDEARNVKADLIIHFGHSEFIKVDFPVIYVEVKDELDLIPFLEKSVEGLKEFKTIGLSYAIQHKQDLDKIIKFYENLGHEIVISKKSGVAAYAGHVVGCEFSGLKLIEEKVDCFVVIGNNFHSMGAALAVNKPVFLVDVYNDSFANMNEIREKILRERFVSIEKFKKSKKIGIIVESKVGQKFGSLDFLLKKFKDADKEIIVITMNEVTPDKLMNFYNVETFVELGCPRIAVDDFSKYERNIITFKEALVGLGLKTWEELLIEGVL
jgi:2-(3-amino-3-carboxypropyl)histidine synthase